MKVEKHHTHVCDYCGADWDKNWKSCQRCKSGTPIKKKTEVKPK